MSYKLGDQIERGKFCFNPSKPWQQRNSSYKYDKKMKARRERRRAKINPECTPEYKRFHGWSL